METLQLDINKRYSYADYLTWFDNVRRELIDGFIKLMSPAPTRKHQLVSYKFVHHMGNFLVKKPCQIYYSPSDVRFPKNKKDKNDKEIFTVVQPDIFIVCDLSKLDDKGCLGAPDMIIEIISPKSSKRDIKDKFEIYEQNGVKEYWIVNPNEEYVSVFFLDENEKYKLVGMYAEDDKIPVNIFNGELEIDLLQIFEE